MLFFCLHFQIQLKIQKGNKNWAEIKNEKQRNLTPANEVVYSFRASSSLKAAKSKFKSWQVKVKYKSKKGEKWTTVKAKANIEIDIEKGKRKKWKQKFLVQKGKFTVVESLQRPQLKSDEEQVCEQVLSFLHPNVNLIKHSLAFVNWTTMGKIQTGYKCNNKSKWKDDWKIENNEVRKFMKKWKTMLRHIQYEE